MNEGAEFRREPRQHLLPDGWAGLVNQIEQLQNVPTSSINEVRSRFEAFAKAPSEQRLKGIHAHIRELQKLANAPLEWGPIKRFGKSFGPHVYIYKREGDTLLAWAPGYGERGCIGLQRLDPVTGHWETIGTRPDGIEAIYKRVMGHLNSDAKARIIFEQNSLLERLTTYGNIGYRTFREQTKKAKWSADNRHVLTCFEVLEGFRLSPTVKTMGGNLVQLESRRGGPGYKEINVAHRQSSRTKEERERMEQQEHVERLAELQSIEKKLVAQSNVQDLTGIEQIKEVDRTRYTAAISWYLSRLYNQEVPNDTDALGIYAVRDPRPTTDEFHNGFCHQYQVSNARFKDMLNDKILAYGLNCLEIEQMRKELNWCSQHPEIDNLYAGIPLVPLNPRRPMSDGDVRALERIEKVYGLEIAYKDVLYVHTFVNERTNAEVRGFAFLYKGKARFLFSSYKAVPQFNE
ncbi:hypothetical protein H6770_01005 [Candidatus Peribacteria bacterium]|nr:hypothetical protein [Candidatus Peribacteria bacterium]